MRYQQASFRRARLRSGFHRLVRRAVCAVIAAILAVAAPPPALAQQTLYWSGTTGTSAPLWSTVSAWSTLPGSWSPPAAAPGAADTAVFSLTTLAGSTQDVFLGGNQAALGLTFSATAATTLRGGSAGAPAVNTLTLGTGGLRAALGAGPVIVGTGSADSVNVVLNGSQAWTAPSGGRLTVGGSVTGAAGAARTLTFNGYRALTAVTGPIADGAAGGTVSLVKSGLGSVRLSGANTYSGSTAITQGTLVITNGAALGNGSSTITVTGTTAPSLQPGGTLLLDGRQAGFTLNRNISLQGFGPNAVSTVWGMGSALTSIGDNVLSGTVALAAGGTAAFINSNFGRLAFTGSLDTGAANASMRLGQGIPASWFSNTSSQPTAATTYAVTGDLAGSGWLRKVGAGMLHLDPASSANFSGIVEAGFGSTRITRNGVLGTRTASGVDSVLRVFRGVTEVRMDNPILTSGSGAGTPANVFFNDAKSSLFVDHGVGSAAFGQTLTLGSLNSNISTAYYTISGRNGYGITFNGFTETGNSTAQFYNYLGGLLTVTGSFWNISSAGNRAFAFGGALYGPKSRYLIEGDILAGGGGRHSVTIEGGGLVTVTGTGSTLTGNVHAKAEGGLQITDFRSINNLASGTIRLGDADFGHLIIGSTVAPGDANSLTSQRVIDLFGATGGGGSIYANQSGPNPVVFGGNLVVSTAGVTKTLTLSGSSTLDNAFNGVIPNSTGGMTSLAKQGLGVWVLGGANTYSGATTISSGVLKLKANAAASTILADSGTVAFNAAANGFAGGTLEFVGQASTTNVENLGPLVPTVGANTIRLTPGDSGTASLVFSALGTVGSVATVNVAGSSSTSTVTLTGVTTGLVGPGFHFGGGNFAYSNGGVLRAPAYDSDAGFVSAPAGSVLPTGTNFDITGDITAQTTGTAATLRFGGSQTLTLSSGQSLTLRTGTAGTNGGILVTGGSATITGGGLTTGGAGSLIFRVDAASDRLTLATPLASTLTGGLVKSGGGALVLSGSNLQTGTTTINEGTVRLSGGLVQLSADSTPIIIRQGATLDLNGVGTNKAIGTFSNSGTVTNSAATPATLTVGNGDAGGTSYGVMEDGPGVLNVTKVGSGGQSWLGTSGYTGVTRIGSTGLVTVDVVADIGQPSGIGRGNESDNAGSLVFDGSTGGLAYQGNLTGLTQGVLTFGVQQAATNRLFTLSGTGARLQSNVSNGNSIVWTNTNAIAFGTTAAQTLTLEGSSTGDNTFRPRIQNNTTSGSATSVTKSGAGIWVLNNAANNYTGPTTISNGGLMSGTAGGIPTTSPLVIGDASGANSGVLLGSGTFARPLAATAVAGSETVTLVGSSGGSGFAAMGEKLVVAIGGVGSPTPLVWGSGGFVPSGVRLHLGSTEAVGEVEFRNPINLNGATRTIRTFDNVNTAADFATISGVISGSGGLVVDGDGLLALTAANTYSGSTTVQGGQIIVSSLGHSATPGVGTSVGLSTDANLDANAVVLGANGNLARLQYIGPGETSDRRIRLANGETRIYADGSGPLVLTNFVNNLNPNVAKTLRLQGTNTDLNEISSNLANNGTGKLSLQIDSSATWVLSGSNAQMTGDIDQSYSASGQNPSNAAVGIGHDWALGSGTARLVNMFAVGAARTVPTTFEFPGVSGIVTFSGDYGLTFSGSVRMPFVAPGQLIDIYNIATPGAPLQFTRIKGTLTDSGNFRVSGAGDTVVGSVESTTMTSGLNFIMNGTGTFTLGTGTEAAVMNLPGNLRGTLTVNAGRVEIRSPMASSTVTLAGGTISGTSTLSGNSFVINNATGTTAISTNLLSGTGVTNLTKSNAGILLLTGSNTYSGTTSVTGGVLSVSSTSALPGWNTGRYSVSTGGALVLGSGFDNAEVPTILLGGTYAADASIGFDTTGGDRDYSGVIGNFIAGSSTNSRGLAKLGSGKLTLSAANTYTGTTAIQEGTLRIGLANAISGSSAVVLTGNGSLDLANSTSAAAVTLSGTGSIFGSATLTGTSYTINNAAGTATVSAILGGTAAALTKSNAGTAVLSGLNTYRGATSVQEGTLEFASIADAGTANSSALGAPTVANSTIALGSTTSAATLRYVGSGHTSNRTINLAGTTGGATIEAAGSGALVLSGTNTATGAGTKTLTLTGSSTADNAIGIIAGTGVNVTKTGPGTWRLAGNSTFTGRLTVLDGTVVVPSVTSASSGSPFGGANTGTSSLPLIGNSAATSGTVALLAQSGTVNRGFWVADSGTGQVVVIGGIGSGTTTFNSGIAIMLGRDVTLQASNDGTAFFANEWRDYSTGTTPAVAFTIGSTGTGNSGTVVFGSDLPFTIKSVNVVAGTLKPNGNGRIKDNTPLSLGSSSSAGTFDLNGFYQSLPSLSFTGTGSRVINGSLALYNGGTAAAPVTVSGTGHEISAAVALDEAATFNVGSGSRLLVSGGMDNPNVGLYGAKGITKSGLGILELTGANTYSGATSITGGQLRVTSGNINGSSGITINGGQLKYNSGSSLTSSLAFAGSGGTLSGTGTIATLVTAGTGAILSPGNSPGIQPYASGLTWAPGGTYEWELNAMSGTAGTNWDLIDVTSGTFSLATLSASNTFLLDLVTLTAADANAAGPLDSPYSPGNYSFLIADFGGATLTVPAGFSTAPGSDLTGLFTLSLARWQSPAPELADMSVKVNSTGDGIELVIVPEPAAIALAALGIAAAAYARRRRRAL